MESATRITRGTIYRYFENKEDIFCQAVMQYYDSPLNVLFSIEADNHTLQSYWVIKMKQLESAYEYLRNYGILINVLAISHYIEVQAARIMPSFKDMILSHKLLNARYWTKVVKNTPDDTVSFSGWRQTHSKKQYPKNFSLRKSNLILALARTF